MSKINIMILFISRITLVKGDVNPVEYGFEDKCHCTNESAVRYVVEKLKEKDPEDLSGENYSRKIDHMFIFSSNDVKNVLKAFNQDGSFKYLDEIGEPLTQEGFFRQRILNFIDDFDEITGFYKSDAERNIVDFDESYVLGEDNEDKTVNEAMTCIAEMVEKIFHRLKGVNLSDVTIHADMSGGFRYVSMMLMAVLRLMQYRGVKIGELAYSNLIQPSRTHGYVERTNPIYGLQDMLSGAAEFNTYGSVNILKHYFNEVLRVKGEDSITVALKDLLKAMEYFSDEVRLCHINNLVDAAKDLQKKLLAFSEAREQNLPCDIHERLLGNLIQIIDTNYQEFYREKIDDIVLIEWCLKHDYMQQALTLYVERLPQVLADKNIIRVSDKYRKELEKKHKNDDAPEEFEFWCFTRREFCDVKRFKDDKEDVSDDHRIDECRNKYLLDYFVKAVDHIADNIDVNSDMKAIDLITNEAMNIMDDLRKELAYVDYEYRIFMKEFFKGYALCYQNPSVLIENNINGEDNRIFNIMSNFMKVIGENFRVSWLKSPWGGKRLKLLTKYIHLNLSMDKVRIGISDLKYSFSKRIGMCIDKGIYELNDNITKEEFMNIWNSYGVIKKERNNSNHAKMNAKIQFDSAASMSKYIQDSLNYVQEIVAKTV